MTDMSFTCPECGESLSVDKNNAGQEGDCPLCGKGIVIPSIPKTGEHHSKTGECPFCGGQIPTAALRCKHCGASLTSGGVSEKENLPVHKDTDKAKKEGMFNPKLNAGGFIGAALGGLMPLVWLLVFAQTDDKLAPRFFVWGIVLGALVGNYLWRLKTRNISAKAHAKVVVNTVKADKDKQEMSLWESILGLCLVVLVLWWQFPNLTGCEKRQQEEAARRVLLEAGEAATPEAISNLVQQVEGAREVEQIQKAAEQGDANAQNMLGGMYADGNGVPQDYVKSVKWTRKAANQGHAVAQSNLGAAYIAGLGVSQNQVEAAKWVRKAAEQGLPNAQYFYGVMCFKGMGVKLDLAQSLSWIRKAADQGLAEAESDLGDAYLNGNGVLQDDEEAVRWFRKAAEKGYAMAQNNLGAMYDNGRGVPTDDEAAVRWYRKASDQGYASAQFNLGVMYDNGEGVPQSTAKAIKWFHKAAEQGHVGAQEAISVLNSALR